jgi:hypothetical protein
MRRHFERRRWTAVQLVALGLFHTRQYAARSDDPNIGANVRLTVASIVGKLLRKFEHFLLLGERPFIVGDDRWKFECHSWASVMDGSVGKRAPALAIMIQCQTKCSSSIGVSVWHNT